MTIFLAAGTPIWIHQADMLLSKIKESYHISLGTQNIKTNTFHYLVSFIIIFSLISLDGAQIAQAMSVKAGSKFYAKNYPLCAVTWLQNFKQPLNIFNQYGEAGFLSYYLHNKGDKVFIFGDAVLMGDPLLYTYNDVITLNPDWNNIITRYGTTIVLFDNGDPLSNVLAVSPRWVKIYQDSLNIAFIPKSEVGKIKIPKLPACALHHG